MKLFKTVINCSGHAAVHVLMSSCVSLCIYAVNPGEHKLSGPDTPNWADSLSDDTKKNGLECLTAVVYDHIDCLKNS